MRVKLIESHLLLAEVQQPQSEKQHHETQQRRTQHLDHLLQQHSQTS